jgi:crotonobetainyl-CoA:carnitine CoA-transferase CaiB-like acyl-CoA transferase
MILPLAGMTLLEVNSIDCPLALRLTIAFAGRVASSLGATVIRFAQEMDDPIEQAEPRIGNTSALSLFLNAGKRLVPWRGPDDVTPALRRHLESAEVLLFDRGAAEIAGRFPRPVAGMASFFADRPNAPSHASAFTVLALSGVLDTVGDPEREPLRLAGHQLAYSAGLSLYAGIAAACFGLRAGNDASVAAETVRVNLFDVAMWLNWKNLAAAAAYGASPTRAGQSHQWQILRCRDGWVALVFMEKDWPALQALLGDDRLRDPRFATEAGRGRHAAELGDIVEGHFRLLTRSEIEAQARAKRLPLGAVWSPVDLMDDPHYLARDFLHTTRTRDGEMYLRPALPVRWHGLDSAAAPARKSAP